MNDPIIELSKYRLEEAEKCLDLSKKLIDMGEYKTSANRAYYSIFHGIRAILALDRIDFRKHSAVISYFRKEYIKTGIFDKGYSEVIGNAFFIRGKSDYDDFYIITKEDVLAQVEGAGNFYREVKSYCYGRISQMNEEPTV